MSMSVDSIETIHIIDHPVGASSSSSFIPSTTCTPHHYSKDSKLEKQEEMVEEERDIIEEQQPETNNYNEDENDNNCNTFLSSKEIFSVQQYGSGIILNQNESYHSKMTKCVIIRSRNMLERFSRKETFYFYVQMDGNGRCKLNNENKLTRCESDRSLGDKRSGSSNSEYELLFVGKRDRKGDNIRLFDVQRMTDKNGNSCEGQDIFTMRKRIEKLTKEQIGNVQSGSGNRNFLCYDIFGNSCAVSFEKFTLAKRIELGLLPRCMHVSMSNFPSLKGNNGDERDYENHFSESSSPSSSHKVAFFNNHEQQKMEQQKNNATLLEKQLLNELKAGGKFENNGCNYTRLENKKPTYSDGNFRLNFHRRVLIPSVKNFQLIDRDANEFHEQNENGNGTDILLQFGKVGNDRFTCDFQSPMTATMAFGIALTQFLF